MAGFPECRTADRAQQVQMETILVHFTSARSGNASGFAANFSLRNATHWQSHWQGCPPYEVQIGSGARSTEPRKRSNIARPEQTSASALSVQRAECQRQYSSTVPSARWPRDCKFQKFKLQFISAPFTPPAFYLAGHTLSVGSTFL